MLEGSNVLFGFGSDLSEEPAVRRFAAGLRPGMLWGVGGVAPWDFVHLLIRTKPLVSAGVRG
jgi:hypothetical protein